MKFSVKRVFGALAVSAVITGLSVAAAASASAATGSIGASADQPVVWGCVNPSTNGLVGGRFYEYDGTNTYPGCSSWAKKVYWNEGSSPSESVRTSVPGLTIDGAPGKSGNGGTGGWGWNDSTASAVTALKAGLEFPLTVTALQSAPAADGAVTLSWNPDDFDFVSANDGTCAPAADAAGVETCVFTDFAHGAKSTGFVFKAKSVNKDAVVSAAVTVGTSTATATFPVAIK